MTKTILSVLLLTCSWFAHGQNQESITDGTTFINSIQPTQPGQLVNPSAVTSPSWTGQTTLGKTVPTGLGTFSNPKTSEDGLNQAKTLGLSGMGNSALTRCENYVPTGDGVLDQECAAVNFMSNKCFTTTNAQAKITGASNNGSAPGCEGTFGAGQAKNVDITNNMKPEENIFDPMRTALRSPDNACTTTTSTTTPALYKNFKGIVSTSVDAITCSQYLSATVTLQTVPANISGYTCPNGTTLDGTSCQTITTSEATPNYVCPVGQRLDGDKCIDAQNVSSPATVDSYTCPLGWTMSESSCTQLESQAASVNYFCPSDWTLSDNTCSQTSITSYTASENYGCTPPATLSGTNCITSTSSTKPATVVKYVCPAGWTLDGSSCSKTTTTNAEVSSYGCPVGWTVNGSDCTKTETAAEKVNHSCPAGWTKTGTSCSQTTTTTTAATPTYYCPSGGTLDNSTCTSSANAPAKYSCPDGGSLVGDKCTVTSSTAAKSKEACPNGIPMIGTSGFCGVQYGFGGGGSACASSYGGVPFKFSIGYACVYDYVQTTYSCPLGSTLNGTQCTSTSSTQAAANYYCSSGLLQDNQCLSSYTATISNYTCPAGQTKSGSNCVASSTSTKDADISYTCSPGWSHSNSSCSLTSSKAATPAYKCSSGWLLSGNTCSLSNSQNASINYGCSDGETLSGDTCTATNTSVKPATIVSYFCPSGGTLSGANCVSQSTASKTPSSSYSCSPGWTLDGNSCSLTNSQSATPIYVCPTGSTLVIDQCKSTQNVLTPATVGSYSCPPGWVLNSSVCTLTISQEAAPSYGTCSDGQTPVAGICKIKVVTTSWTDTCKDYAQSAGVNITPQ